MQPSAGFENARTVLLEMEVPIAASPQRVWEATVNEMDQWWLVDFRCAGKPGKIVFEARVGGQMYEDSGDGAGIHWFRVISLDPGKSMHLSGHIAPPFGGPATALMYLNFEAQEDGTTVLKVTHSLVGKLDDGFVSSLDSGWKQLFVDGLKQHAEK